jgi:hypothetical protein
MVEIEEGRMDSLATAPTFNKEERADATINPEERNHIQNLREQKLMDMLEHICVEVSNMSKAIQNLNLVQQPKPNLQPRSDLEARLSSLELKIDSIMARVGATQYWPPKGHPAPPTPSYDPNYRRPRISDFGPYDPENYNTGFTGFGKP